MESDNDKPGGGADENPDDANRDNTKAVEGSTNPGPDDRSETGDAPPPQGSSNPGPADHSEAGTAPPPEGTSNPGPDGEEFPPTEGTSDPGPDDH
jgi:hypothetical protein